MYSSTQPVKPLIGNLKRGVIDSKPRNPKPWRAHCECGHVSEGKTAEQANARLIIHIEGATEMSNIVTFYEAEFTRIREIRAYAAKYDITINEAIVDLVNAGLSHQREPLLPAPIESYRETMVRNDAFGEAPW